MSVNTIPPIVFYSKVDSPSDQRCESCKHVFVPHEQVLGHYSFTIQSGLKPVHFVHSTCLANEPCSHNKKVVVIKPEQENDYDISDSNFELIFHTFTHDSSSLASDVKNYMSDLGVNWLYTKRVKRAVLSCYFDSLVKVSEKETGTDPDAPTSGLGRSFEFPQYEEESTSQVFQTHVNIFHRRACRLGANTLKLELGFIAKDLRKRKIEKYKQMVGISGFEVFVSQATSLIPKVAALFFAVLGIGMAVSRLQN